MQNNDSATFESVAADGSIDLDQRGMRKWNEGLDLPCWPCTREEHDDSADTTGSEDA